MPVRRRPGRSANSSRTEVTRLASRSARTACQVLTAMPATSDAATHHSRDDSEPVSLPGLLQAVAGARRAGLDRLVRQVPLDVRGEAVGRLVPPACGPSPAPSSRSSRVRPASASTASPARSRGWRPRSAGRRSCCSLALGRGASTSRTIRRISSSAALPELLAVHRRACR